jgi:general secretion pathway protein D
MLEIVGLVDVEVALDELAIIPLRFADAADLTVILNQLFASGRLRRATGTPPGAAMPTGPVPSPAAPPLPSAGVPPTAGAAGSTTTADRGPLIIAERRSNSLILYARRQELETIRKLIAQLDVNIYGGRRVFVYFAENSKAKELAATLNAIYGGPSTSTTTTPTTPGFGARPSSSPFGGAATSTPVSMPAGGPSAGAGTLSEVGVIEGQVRFIADEVTNAIIVTTFPRVWNEIEATIKQLDRMPRQVLIEVLVAEISLTDDTRLGIDWAVKSGKWNIANQSVVIPSSGSPSITPLSRTLPIASSLVMPLGSGLTAFTFASDQFMAILNTLAAENRLNVLSNPHVMTSENKKAVINVSQSVPIITSQQAPLGGAITGGTTAPAVVGTQSVEYRDAGVILTVTPRIGEHGTVAIDVKQEVNAIGAPQAPTNSPIIIKREAETSVVLSNNATLVLGGLIQDRLTVADRGVPFFKDLPLLGYLFGTKERTIEKTELLILITPRVVSGLEEASRITEEMRRTTPELNEAVQRAPRPPAPPPPPQSVPERMPPPPPPSGGGAPAPSSSDVTPAPAVGGAPPAAPSGGTRPAPSAGGPPPAPPSGAATPAPPPSSRAPAPAAPTAVAPPAPAGIPAQAAPTAPTPSSPPAPASPR